PLPLVSPLGLSYAYQPQFTMPRISSFSIGKTSLAGIIDDFHNLRLISDTFLKLIMFRVLQRLVSDAKQDKDDQECVLSISTLPKHWQKPTVSNYDLQQLEEAGLWPQA